MDSSLVLDQNFLCILFRLCETFYLEIFNVSEGSPFFHFLRQIVFSKCPKPLLTITGIEISQNDYFPAQN